MLTKLGQSFAWTPPATPFSSMQFLLTCVIGYPICVFAGQWLLQRGSAKPLQLKYVAAIHNLILFVWSLGMFVGMLSSVVEEALEVNAVSWLFCTPLGTQAAGRIYFWSYIYYISKFYELGDTAVLVLKQKPVSFLHVYHHSLVMLMSYLWLEQVQSLQAIALLVNTGVHIVMYFYFFLTSLGIRPRWKKIVTNIQIVQFGFSFLVSLPLLYSRFWGERCSGFSAWLFNCGFNISLFALFIHFRVTQYKPLKKQ